MVAVTVLRQSRGDEAPDGDAYRLHELGWLQFERLCGVLLAQETGREIDWSGHADRMRAAVLVAPVALPTLSVRHDVPVEVLVVWASDGGHPSAPESERLRLRLGQGDTVRPVVVMTNLDAAVARATVGDSAGDRSLLVIGRDEVGQMVDRHAPVRLVMSSVMGRRDLGSLVTPRVRGASSVDLERAQSLARVFWPTRAYEQARAVLVRHRFVVLTGPPEMGKTAIAQMLALGLMTDGWEAHDCTSPDQLWSVFDPERRQVFVADDAFGSTEFRPDAAERWSRSLGRVLSELGDGHRLIWTSRPAPLKAGLRRVQQERHAERFPSPAEVLVDASDLDLAEKTLILFRHAKDRGLSSGARSLVRSSALTLVEHPYFTPERIRRLVADRLDALQRTAARAGGEAVRDELAEELSTPTEAMRTSYRALGEDHRELLIALLDAPAGWIDERELTAIIRRHRPGGFDRPPSELIDRLTDHFLRVTTVGIGWVHPSWRDLVITELQDDAGARRRFLAVSGLFGVMLALSVQGGIAGERMLPLLLEDLDWDVLGDRLAVLAAELEDHQATQLLLALQPLQSVPLGPVRAREARSLVGSALSALARRWDRDRRILPISLLEHWYALASWRGHQPDPPALARTWIELHPGTAPWIGGDEDLVRLEEWLGLVTVIGDHDPGRFTELGFDSRHEAVFLALIDALTGAAPTCPRARTLRLLEQIRDLGSQSASAAARSAIDGLVEHAPSEERWYSPEDIDARPSDELVDTSGGDFTRDDVARVLADL